MSNYEAEFVDRNRAALIQRVIAVMPIADELKNKIHDETYAEIKAEKTSQGKMRKLYDALNAGGDRVKTDFYYALRNNELYLFKDLGGVTANHDEADVNMERRILQ
ncbi:apoptosis-associated speck-like protein containing a CARD [Danio rerio]|uniref:Apoptosis-associated speck-like protein containing a CARD n=1 Tax=Danio rerio TaxID=7955 RepID=A0AC58HW22_DANRE